MTAGAANGEPRRRRRFLLLAVIVVVALAVVAALASIGYALTSDDDSADTSIVDVPIRFTVRDMNRTPLKCGNTPSGTTYEIAGRLVAPAEVSSSATLYLSGVIFSALFEFHNDITPGYNYLRDMAKLGHTSLIVDRVGYGDTAPYPPDGRGDCLGTHADIAHQIVTAMRKGDYSIIGSDREPTSFERVALGGYSVGALIAELESATFRDVEALVVIGWAHQGFTTYGADERYIRQHCSPGLPKPPGGLRGYFNVLPPEKVPGLVSARVDPKILAAFATEQQLDACGQLISLLPWIPTGLYARTLAKITVPVLIIFGYYDVLFHFDAWQQEWDHFTGTRDRSLIGIPDGQLLMLDEHASMTERMISTWLKRRGF